MSATDPMSRSRVRMLAHTQPSWASDRIIELEAERDEAIAENKRLTDELNDVGAECSRLESDILDIHDALADPDEPSAINAEWIIERIGQLREAIAERDAYHEALTWIASPKRASYDRDGTHAWEIATKALKGEAGR